MSLIRIVADKTPALSATDLVSVVVAKETLFADNIPATSATDLITTPIPIAAEIG